MVFRDIADSPARMVAAREASKSQLVEAEVFETQGGIRFWYCFVHERFSPRQFKSVDAATHDAALHNALHERRA